MSLSSTDAVSPPPPAATTTPNDGGGGGGDSSALLVGVVPCRGCGREFPSRNAVFKHLLATEGACLGAAEHDEFRLHVLNQQRIKVLLLVGYAVEETEEGIEDEQTSDAKDAHESPVRVRNGDDAARILHDALLRHLNVDPGADPNNSDLRMIRALGHTSRGTDVAAQDRHTGAITEVYAVRLPPLSQSQSVQAWIDDINASLQQKIEEEGPSTAVIRVLGRLDLPPAGHKFNPTIDFSQRRVEFLIPMDFFWPPPAPHRQAMGGAQTLRDFFAQIFSFDDGANPEDDNGDGSGGADSKPVHYSRTDEALLGVERPKRAVLLYMHWLKKKMQSLTTQVQKLDVTDAAALQEKEYSQQKRQNVRAFREQTRKAKKENKCKRVKKQSLGAKEGELIEDAMVENGTANDDEAERESAAIASATIGRNDDNESSTKTQRSRGNKGTHVLRRKRFHNFTPFVMAHEFLAFRRLDRFYHRATLRFEPEIGDSMHLLSSSVKNSPTRPFLVLSLSGDLFLTGQAPRIVGLFIAMATGAIDDDIVDCVFDEKYPHLVPTPPAPLFAMLSGDTFYTKWEGKLKTILTPRKADHFSAGWNDPHTLRRVREWTIFLRERIARAWVRGGIAGNGDDRLALVRQWNDEVLQPWASRAREQNKDYRQWKSAANGRVRGEASATPAIVEAPIEQDQASSMPVGTANVPPLESVDPTVPELYEKVLFYLRQADASELWPSTTPKRQLVMISTVKEGSKDHGDPASATSLSEALQRAQSSQTPDSDSRASAYTFEEGQGGASGSFSVGAMPDGQSAQPRANRVFPQLMKAAFELEQALRPDREPSSTIAVNRNAQFRPHTDSGAGAGQSTSLIVGLGTYAGGELVVEGEMVDIRYKVIEFNGWKQRHWTMPFVGERYSLVWFTPKGCEGVHGIDLCKDIVLS
jgi:hypothetical protein